MRSYASVDRIEGDVVVLEVEMIEVFESESTPFGEVETHMMNIKFEELASDIDEEIHEGDILVVSHNGVTIDFACYIDREEKEARAEYLKTLLAK